MPRTWRGARRSSASAIGGSVSVDMARVKARKDAISGAVARRGVETGLRKTENCTVYQGHARFESPNVVSVGAEQITAERIFINVGGRALVPDMPGVGDVPILTNSSMMDVDFLPRHLIIVGGSYIGLEFGQMFRRFGSEVTIVEMGAAPDPARRRRRVSGDPRHPRGRRHRRSAQCEVHRLSRTGQRDYRAGRLRRGRAGSHRHRTCCSPSAAGRTPTIWASSNAGVTVDERGYIVVDDQLRTNVPGIWALGDCNGKGAFTHTSFNDAEIVAANLLDNDPRRVSDRIPAYALFVDPPLGRAGLTEAEVRQDGPAGARRQARHEGRVSRAVEKGETQGFMKIVVDAETTRDPGRGDPRHRRRRSDPLDPGRDVRQGALYGHQARRAHPSDRLRADPDDAVVVEAALTS